MDRPVLPPVPAGESALPAFLVVEAWAEEQLAAERARWARALDDARQEAERIRVEAESALRQDVLEGERESSRSAADRARDRLSAARASVTRWIDRAEAESLERVEVALARVVGG